MRERETEREGGGDGERRKKSEKRQIRCEQPHGMRRDVKKNQFPLFRLLELNYDDKNGNS